MIQKFYETTIESNDLRKPAEFEWTCWKRFEFRLKVKVKGIVDGCAVNLWIESLICCLDQRGCRCHGAESGYACIFKSSDPAERAHAIVRATTHYMDPAVLAEVSRGLGEPMKGIDTSTLDEAERLQTRGW